MTFVFHYVAYTEGDEQERRPLKITANDWADAMEQADAIINEETRRAKEVFPVAPTVRLKSMEWCCDDGSENWSRSDVGYA